MAKRGRAALMIAVVLVVGAWGAVWVESRRKAVDPPPPPDTPKTPAAPEVAPQPKSDLDRDGVPQKPWVYDDGPVFPRPR